MTRYRFIWLIVLAAVLASCSTTRNLPDSSKHISPDRPPEAILHISTTADNQNLVVGTSRGRVVIFGLKEANLKHNWMPDESTNKCSQCGRLFTVSVRRHHCRQCGRVLCDNCTAQKMFVPEYGSPRKLQRVCRNCYDEQLRKSMPNSGLFKGPLSVLPIRPSKLLFPSSSTEPPNPNVSPFFCQ